MNINNVYSNRFLIPESFHDSFERNRKEHLNDVERIGLEAILAAFVRQYEEEAFGDECFYDITNYTRFNENCVDILDGCYDTYIFDNYAINSVWMTENGIPMLDCFLLESDEYDDPFEIVKNTDWWSDCEYVLFRLG